MFLQGVLEAVTLHIDIFCTLANQQCTNQQTEIFNYFTLKEHQRISTKILTGVLTWGSMKSF